MSHSPLRGTIVLLLLGLGGLLTQPPRLCAQETAAPQDARYVDIRDKSSSLHLVEKASRVLRLQTRLKSVDGFDPEVIRVSEIKGHANLLRLHAVVPGVTTMVLVDEMGDSYTIEILVAGDTREFDALVKQVYPDSSVKVTKMKDSAVIHGWVTQSDHVAVVMDMAKRFYPEALNSLRVSGDQQVQLHVKIMEVQRGKIRNLGFNFLELQRDAFGSSHIGGLTPLTALTVPFGGPPGMTVSPTAATATFGIVNNDMVFQGFIEALKQESLLKVLAEPTLVAINGRPGNFLSGGEFPILVPQGFGTVSVQFRPFGVRLEFVCNNVGNGRVRLDVSPEVSEKDLSSTVTVGSITIPALSVRRANTQVEMNVGETLIIAGLIFNRVQARTSKTPFLGELPVIGAAFRRVSYDEAETELMIMVTPELAGPVTDGCIPAGPGSNTVSPTDRELFGSGYLEVPKFCPDPDCSNLGPGAMGPPQGNTGVVPQMIAPGSVGSSIPPDTFFGPPVKGPPPGDPAPPGPTGSGEKPATMPPSIPSSATLRSPPRSKSTASRTTGQGKLSAPTARSAANKPAGQVKASSGPAKKTDPATTLKSPTRLPARSEAQFIQPASGTQQPSRKSSKPELITP